eukprot:gene2650-2894_t
MRLTASFTLKLLLVVGYCVCNVSPLAIAKDLISPEWLNWAGCISHHEAKALLALHSKCQYEAKPKVEVKASIDLSFSKSPLLLTKEGVHLKREDEALLATWPEVKDISSKTNNCFALYDDGSKPWKISTMSPVTGYAASLCPPLSAPGGPTLLLAGFTMHRIAGEEMNPIIDTQHKLRSIFIPSGSRVLDTCMGLGYTAIGAGQLVSKGEGGGKVTTCEVDPASLEMCAYNPWSRGLFDGSLPIEIVMGDVSQHARSWPDGSFDVIIHDPPARALCKESDLYGEAFYSELYRLLAKPRGRLFHYIGNPNSREAGRLFRGVQDRLRLAGFKNVATDKEAFGVVGTA